MRDRVNKIYEELSKLQMELQNIRSGCKHESVSVRECFWAPGHGGPQYVCNECDEVIPRYGTDKNMIVTQTANAHYFTSIDGKVQ